MSDDLKRNFSVLSEFLKYLDVKYELFLSPIFEKIIENEKPHYEERKIQKKDFDKLFYIYSMCAKNYYNEFGKENINEMNTIGDIYDFLCKIKF